MKDDKTVKPKELQYIWTILIELTIVIWINVRKHKRWNKPEK